MGEVLSQDEIDNLLKALSTVDTVVDADAANARIRLIDEITTIASQSIIP